MRGLCEDRLKFLAAGLFLISGLSLTQLPAQSFSVDSIEDKALLEVMIEDTTSELARNQASLKEARNIYQGLQASDPSQREFRDNVEAHVRYYEEVIESQKRHLSQLTDRRKELEKEELQKLRNLYNFGSPYQDRKRTAFLDLILQPRSAMERFGETGKSRVEDLDAQLFSALGGLQNRLNAESENRREASQILLDREANVNTILAMQEVSQSYYDERFVLYDKMNQTYEQILRWRPDLAIFFKPPPQPKPPDVYRRALERMQTEE